MPTDGDEVSEEVIVVAKPVKSNDSPFGGNPFDDDPRDPDTEIIDITPEEVEVIGTGDPGDDTDDVGNGDHRLKGMGSILIAAGLGIGFADTFGQATMGPVNPLSEGPLGWLEEQMWGDDINGIQGSTSWVGDELNLPEPAVTIVGEVAAAETPFWVETIAEGILATVDPPRSDYQEIVIEPLEDPYAVERWLDDPEHQRVSEIGYMVRAAVLAEERRQGAALAGDDEWVGMHACAVEYFTDEAMSLAEGLPLLSHSQLLGQIQLILRSADFQTRPVTHRRAVLQAMAALVG